MEVEEDPVVPGRKERKVLTVLSLIKISFLTFIDRNKVQRSRSGSSHMVQAVSPLRMTC